MEVWEIGARRSRRESRVEWMMFMMLNAEKAMSVNVEEEEECVCC